MKIAMMTATAALLATPALAAPVDLSTWQSDGAGNWTLQNPPANDAVLQTTNGGATTFFQPGSLSQGKTLAGEITVQTGSDDDYIGFVLGYEDEELSSASANYVLIHWKQGNQSGDTAGLRMSLVQGNGAPTLFDYDDGLQTLDTATNLGNTGWVDNQTYNFDLVFTDQLIQVSVDGVLELSATAASAGLGAFDDGAFGFYNHSQAQVLYAGIEEGIAPDPDPTPVPAPGALGLIGLGILGLGALRRRR
jgi:hypothetical protein|tara:strand:+ start:51096 stop:51842 length:747 start_codon:yes stop_codon:yes gene_type:complete